MRVIIIIQIYYNYTNNKEHTAHGVIKLISQVVVTETRVRLRWPPYSCTHRV